MFNNQPQNYYNLRNSPTVIQQPSSPRVEPPTQENLQPASPVAEQAQEGNTQVSQQSASPPRMMPFSVSLEKFSGDGKVKPEQFIRQYEQFVVLNRLSQEQALAGIRFYLDGQAKFWYDALETPPASLDEAKTMITNKFKVSECFDYDMFNLMQEANEKVDDYLNRLERKNQKANLPQSVLIAIALKGLRQNLRVAIIPLEPKDLDSLRDMARKHERAQASVSVNNISNNDISDFKSACTDIIQQLAASVHAVNLNKACEQEPQTGRSSPGPQPAHPERYQPPHRRQFQDRRSSTPTRYQDVRPPQHMQPPQNDSRRCRGCNGESCFSYRRSNCPAFYVRCQICDRLHHTARACLQNKK